MKKIGILLAILAVAGAYAMADEAVAVQDDALFLDVDAVVLSQAEMEEVDGGQHPGDYGETEAGRKAALRMRQKDYNRYQGEAKLYGIATDVCDAVPLAWRLSGGPNGTEERYFKAVQKSVDADADVKRLAGRGRDR